MSISLAYWWDLYEMVVKWSKRLYNTEWRMIEKLPKFIYQTWLKDWPEIIFNELKWVIENWYSDNIEHHIWDINKKIIIILPWALSTTASLSKIKEKFIEEEYSYYALNYRLTFLNHKEKRNKIIKETSKILLKLKKENKEVILFGYSYWWALAETIWDKQKIDTISLSTWNDFSYTPFTTIWKFVVNIINLITAFQFKNIIDFKFKEFKNRYNKYALGNTKVVNNTWKDNIYKIIEEFSFSVDLPEDQRKKCHILKDTYSHFAVNNDSTIEAIMDWIKKFEK